MLTYKIGTKNIQRENILLTVESILWDEAADEITIVSGNHGLHNGDIVLFVRSDGSEIGYRQEVPVKEIIDENIFKISGFPIQFLSFTEGEVADLRFLPDNQYTRKYLELTLADGEQHDVITDRDDVIVKERVYGNYEEYTVGMKRCDGDYALYEDIFLYQVLAGQDKYIFPAEESEKKNTLVDLYIIPTGTLLAYVSNPVNTPRGRTWKYSDGVLVLKNCFIPSRINGHDDRTRIFWEAESTTIASLIAESASILTMYVRDERFIVPNGEVSENALFCDFKPGAELYKISYALEVSDIISQDFGINLFQEELLRNEYVEKIVGKAKNAIIDYEKQCFTPVYESNGSIYDINEIIFNLHFREREKWLSDGIVDEYAPESDSRTCEYGEWKTNNNLYWNNYKYYGGDRLVPEPADFTPDTADLLGHLGFTDDDIYYERNRVGKSFLRLLFFDSADRRTQKLLYTSVIYLNAPALYEKYVADIRMGTEGEHGCEEGKKEIVYAEKAPRRLDASFACKNKYSSSLSSEGFYLYLFPGVLNENGEGTIYMKVEFNHAKYGYTIPMIMPLNENGYPIEPTSPNFPIDYVATNVDESGRTYEYVNTQKLFKDMYIPIKVKFEENSRRYIWFLENGIQTDGTAKFNMFEPKVNRAEGINVELDSYTIGWLGGTINGRVIITEGGHWIVSSASEGVSVSPSEGDGNTDITVTLPQNREGSPQRTLSVTFSGVNSYARAEVQQDAGGLDLTVSPSSIQCGWVGMNNVQITVTDRNSIGWTVSSSSNFIDLQGMTGRTGTFTFNISIARSGSDESRIGEIIIQDILGLGAARVITVSQEAAPHSLSVYPTNMIFPEDIMDMGDAYPLTIYDEENIGWKIVDGVPDWLDFYEEESGDTPYSGVGSVTLLFYTTKENMSFEELFSQIKIEGGWNIPLDPQSTVKKYVTVVQDMILDNYAEIYIEKEGSIMVSQGSASLSYEYTWSIYYSDTPERYAPDELWQSGDDTGWAGWKSYWGNTGTDPILTRELGVTKYLNCLIRIKFENGEEQYVEEAIPITIEDPGGTYIKIPYGVKLPERYV